MHIYFIRNTHDKEGLYLWDDLPYKETNILTHGRGVHALNRSQTKTTLEEYVAKHYQYKRLCPSYMIPTVSQLLEDLSILTKTCFVTTEIHYG